MNAHQTVVIIGRDEPPTAELASDVSALGYRPELLCWPDSDLHPRSTRPIAVLLDLRTLGLHADSAARAAARAFAFHPTPLIAVVPEQEAARLDLSWGFDDLLLTPYRPAELAARLRLCQARLDAGPRAARIHLGPLAINETTYQVTIDRRPVYLTLQEYRLLLFLARNPGRVFTREELLFHVWGQEYLGGTRTVDVHIRRLRAKTEAAADLIETVRGVGYRLLAPETA